MTATESSNETQPSHLLANDLLSAQMLLEVLERGFGFIDHLIDEMPMIVLICDNHTRILRANILACQRLGADQDEIIGKELGQIIDSRGQKYLDHFFLEQNIDRDKAATLYYINDGDSPIFWQIKTLDRGNSPIPRVLVIGSLVKEYNKQITTETAAKTHLQSLATLAGGVAHEVNNPLAIISGQLEILKDALNIDDSKTTKIELAIDRIANIVRGLRRFGESHLSGAKSTLDIVNVVKEAHRELKSLQPDQASWLKLKLCQPIDIVGDYKALRSAFVEIFKNAIDAVRDLDDDKRSILVSIKPSPKEITLICADNGVGMTQDQVKRIFDPFYTCKEIGVGTGLGMSLVHSAIALSRGKIDIKSAPKEGTKVIITFNRSGALHGDS